MLPIWKYLHSFSVHGELKLMPEMGLGLYGAASLQAYFPFTSGKSERALTYMHVNGVNLDIFLAVDVCLF